MDSITLIDRITYLESQVQYLDKMLKHEDSNFSAMEEDELQNVTIDIKVNYACIEGNRRRRLN